MSDYLLHLPDDDSKSLQARIREAIVAAILGGHIPVDSPLPSGRKLSEQLGVARNTVVLAYQQLVDEGYLLARERSKITVGDIARVAMDMSDAEQAGLPGDVANGPIGQAVIRPLWTEFQEQILVMMDEITVEELTTRAFRNGVPSEVYNRITYSI